MTLKWVWNQFGGSGPVFLKTSKWNGIEEKRIRISIIDPENWEHCKNICFRYIYAIDTCSSLHCIWLTGGSLSKQFEVTLALLSYPRIHFESFFSSQGWDVLRCRVTEVYEVLNRGLWSLGSFMRGMKEDGCSRPQGDRVVFGNVSIRHSAMWRQRQGLFCWDGTFWCCDGAGTLGPVWPWDVMVVMLWAWRSVLLSPAF